VAKPAAWVFVGAVFATAGVAHAQDTLAPVIDAPSASVPWYQRFTTSTGLTEHITGLSENDRDLAPEWSLSQRWGVTVDVREAQRLERSPERQRTDQTAVGAYYQFTPRVRVGGEVSVETPQNLTQSSAGRAEAAESSAGVRLQSAFRF
jgi:hypothetical protein